MEVDLGHGQRLLRQRLPVAEERVLAEVDVDARRREVAELLDEGVDAVAGSDHVLVPHQSTTAPGSTDSKKQNRKEK